MIWIKHEADSGMPSACTGTDYAVPPTVNPSMRKVG